MLFSSYLLGDIEVAPDLRTISPDVLREPDELCIQFRIEPLFYQSSRFVYRTTPLLERAEDTTIGTLPVYPAARKPPQILFHAGVADLEATGAGPAKGLFHAAA